MSLKKMNVIDIIQSKTDKILKKYIILDFCIDDEDYEDIELPSIKYYL